MIRFGTLAPENGRQVSFVRLPDASWPMAARLRGHEESDRELLIKLLLEEPADATVQSAVAQEPVDAQP